MVHYDDIVLSILCNVIIIGVGLYVQCTRYSTGDLRSC